jgi:hypothetical protein
MSVYEWVNRRVDKTALEGIDFFAAYVISGFVILWGLWELNPWWWDRAVYIPGDLLEEYDNFLRWTGMVPIVFGSLTIVACAIRSFRLLSISTFVLACFWLWAGVIFGFNLFSGPEIVLYGLLVFIYGYGYLGLQVHRARQDKRIGERRDPVA